MKTTEEVQSLVVRAIAEAAGTTAETVAPRARLCEDLLMDWAATRILWASIKLHFNLEVFSNDAQTLITVQDVVKYVAAYAP